jgi:hypothetical protein
VVAFGLRPPIPGMLPFDPGGPLLGGPTQPAGPQPRREPPPPAQAPRPQPAALDQAPEPAADVEPSIRERYQEQAYAQLGLTREQFETMNPIERNTLISGAYADMYSANRDTMKWAGMASFASDTVGLGMMSAPAMDLLPGGPDGGQLRDLLAEGNGQLFQDIYWQHMAFQEGGIEELQRAAEAGEVDPQQLAAWSVIAQGQEALSEARASGDEEAERAAQDLVWQGNGDLLRYEQQVFLQDLVYDSGPEARDTFKRMTAITDMVPGLGMPSPIPGGESFQSHRQESGASGKADVGNIDQRWDWISNSMLPSFRDLEENRPEEMTGYMDRFSANARSGMPGVPQLPRVRSQLPGLPRMDGLLRRMNPFDKLF